MSQCDLSAAICTDLLVERIDASDHSGSAGVDQFDFSALPSTLPVVRMVEPGIIRGMVEYVTHAVLDLHRDMPEYRRAQRRNEWRPLPVKTAGERRVGVLGLGSLGQAVLAQLHAFGFDCAGWSRSRHAIEGVRCMAGEVELHEFLARNEILVCLLPLTDATRGFLNAARLAKMRPGALFVNTARGAIVDEAALTEALRSGRIAAAGLDVFVEEPLPAGHPLAGLENVVLASHSAFRTPEATDNLIEASLEQGKEVPIEQAHLTRALGEARPTTSEWLTTARNYARYANQGGLYDDVLSFLDKHAKA